MSAISSGLSIAYTGLSSASARMANTSQKIASGSGDMVQNVVDLDIDKNAFKASAVVLKTADQMMGTLLDMLDTDRK